MGATVSHDLAVGRDGGDGVDGNVATSLLLPAEARERTQIVATS